MSLPLSRLSRGCAAALALTVALAASRPALAQTAGEKAAAAQALFDEAMRLMKAGQATEACPKLEESQRLDAGMATQFRLAECYEKLGKLASAWASFVAVADSAAVARLPDREAAARKRAEALSPRIAHLTLTVPPEVASLEGLDVQRDGVSVDRPLWGVPLPIDPGEHVLRVRAAGKKPSETRVTAADAAALNVTLGPLEDLPRGTSLPPPPPPPPSPQAARSRAPAIVLGALAVAGLGAGAGLFAGHSGKSSSAQTLSGQIKGGGGTCAAGASAPDPRCGTLASDASSSDALGNGSTVAFAAGGAAAVAMVIYLVWPSAPASSTGLRLVPVTGVTSGSQHALFLSGSF